VRHPNEPERDTQVAFWLKCDTAELQVMGVGQDQAAICINLQYSDVIREVRVEFDNRNVTMSALWQALKHFEVQLGNVAELDANTVLAAYQTGDELKLYCRDCQPQLVSVDPDLLMWLRFDDPTFVCKDSSNYRADTQVVKQALPDSQNPLYTGLLSLPALCLRCGGTQATS